MVALLEEYKPHRENWDTPSKNRSTEIFPNFSDRVENLLSQVVDTYQENDTCSYETVSGVRYYGFRYYDPENGRWLNRDPLGEDGGFNLYAIVSNNPIKLLDLLGLVQTTGQEIWVMQKQGKLKSIVSYIKVWTSKGPELIKHIATILTSVSTVQLNYEVDTVDIPSCYVIDEIIDHGPTVIEKKIRGDLLIINYTKSKEYTYKPDPNDPCCK